MPSMQPKQWAIKEINSKRETAWKLLQVVHSRCEGLRKACQDFQKPEVVELMREVKVKVREAQELLKRVPEDIGKAILRAGPVPLRVQPALPGLALQDETNPTGEDAHEGS